MNILFLHQNFPGQFRALAPALAAAGHGVHALSLHLRAALPGVTAWRYALKRPAAKDIHPLLREVEAKVHRAEACASALSALDRKGYRPDLVIANPGWGEALFVKDVWPQVKLVCLLEFFYGTRGSDFGFDREFADPTLEGRLKIRMKNLHLLEALHAMDRGVAPTPWQASRLPAEYAAKLDVIFDGIDTDRVRPDPAARFVAVEGGLDFRAGDPVITFVNRNLEPYRGYHVFMRALPTIQRALPDAHIVIVGDDGVSYGAAAPAGTTWKQKFLDEMEGQLDLRRVHFVGQLPYPSLLTLFQVSAAHVYLTYPFVLSWSCLEAMSAGCHVVGSRTAPVVDFIEDGVNGSLVDFFDVPGLAARVVEVVSQRADAGPEAALRRAARQTVIDRCDWTRVCLPRYCEMLGRTVGQPV